MQLLVIHLLDCIITSGLKKNANMSLQCISQNPNCKGNSNTTLQPNPPKFKANKPWIKKHSSMYVSNYDGYIRKMKIN
jgi:hypothetical protein